MGNSHIVNRFKNKKVLVVGDTIIDIYTYCNVVCEALYAPIPEAEEIRSQVSFGGNSLVASNILELGGKVTFLSVIGADEAAQHYDSFVHPNLRKLFFVDPSRRTTVKQRWFAEDGKALLQVNNVDNHDLAPQIEKKVCATLEREIPESDVIVVMDPQHGFLTEKIVDRLKALSKKFKIPLYVDVQVSHRESRHELYKGADTFFLNRGEAKAVHPTFTAASGRKALEDIARKLTATNVVVKLGERGSVALFGGRYIKTPAHTVEAVDVCGAGDAFLAAFSLCDPEAPEDSLSIANIWGGLSTMMHGTLPPKKKELLRILRT